MNMQSSNMLHKTMEKIWGIVEYFEYLRMLLIEDNTNIIDNE